MKQQHSLVIGGTRGIGSVHIRALVEENHLVSVIGKSAPVDADRVSSSIRYWSVDLVDLESLSNVLTEIIRVNGKLSNLIFFQRYRQSEDRWRGEIETTLTATKVIIERLADQFDETHEKSIVVVSSLASDFVAPEQDVGYHVAKSGLNQMVRYYAVVLGPRGIRINAVSPGAVLKEESKEFYLRNESLHKLYQEITPLGRMGTAAEIVSVIRFLCGPKASFITGQNIIVDGGLSLNFQQSLAQKLGVFFG